MRDASDKSQPREISQSAGPVLLKAVIKTKESLRDCHSQKETQGTGNRMECGIPSGISERKRTSGKEGGNRKPGRWLTDTTSAGAALTHRAVEDVGESGTGCGESGDSELSCSDSVNLKLL